MITSSSSSSGGTNLMWNFTLQRLSPTISTHYSAAENKTIMHKMPRKVLTVVGRGNTTISFALIIIIVIVVITVPEMCQSQQHTIVELKQGTVSGLKVFPESSRTPVYSFLGIPYAKAPVDNLRFAVRTTVMVFEQRVRGSFKKPIESNSNPKLYSGTQS